MGMLVEALGGALLAIDVQWRPPNGAIVLSRKGELGLAHPEGVDETCPYFT
jgi:hypothetical protein